MRGSIAAVHLGGTQIAWPTGLTSIAGLALLGALHASRALPVGEIGWASLVRAASITGVCILILGLSDFYERQLGRLRAKLRAAATTDPLTGLANRGSLDDALAVEHHRLARYPDSCLSIVLFDVDHLQEYNESNGHQAGDEVLKRIAETALQRARRAPDLLGRYGGDEMLAVLPATSGLDASIVADCIRRDIESLALAHPASEHGVVTVSLGVVAEKATNRGSIDSLLTDADQALSQAKAGGRNCVASVERTLDHDS